MKLSNLFKKKSETEKSFTKKLSKDQLTKVIGGTEKETSLLGHEVAHVAQQQTK